MKSDEQAPSAQPTSMTGSDWQRQALAAARAGAAAAQSGVSMPAMQTARERAAAQDVPDMLAAAEPAPAQSSAPQPAQQQPMPPAAQAAPTGEAIGRPVVSGALAEDVPATPVIGTGGTPTGKKLFIIALVLVFVLGIAAAGYFLFLKDDKGSAGASQQAQEEREDDESDTSPAASPLQINARNIQRLTDAGQILAATAEYAASNNGKLPSGYESGNLVGADGGTPVAVPLEYYETIQVASGEQPPLDKDELWLVTGAACDAETGGTVESTSRAAAALYGKENSEGGFEGACVDM